MEIFHTILAADTTCSNIQLKENYQRKLRKNYGKIEFGNIENKLQLFCVRVPFVLIMAV